MNVKTAVLFDLDGTLLDTLGDLTDSVNYILEKYGFPKRTMSEIRDYLGYGAAHLIKSALPVGIEPSLADSYIEEYKIYYGAHSQIKTGPYEGIIQMLGDLKKRGIMTAVVSNKPDFSTKKLCDYYFGNLLDMALGERADIAKKPSAEPLLYAAKLLGAERTVFVGDAETDVLASNNAGIPCVSVTWGFRDEDQLKVAGARHFARDAEELEKKIIELIDLEDK